MAILAASILDANWLDLENEIKNVDEAGVDAFSIDIMDGSFVPRITFGAHVVSKIRNITDLPIEVHLMVSNPEKHIEIFCDAGADQVLVHLEAVSDIDRLKKIAEYVHSRNLSFGIAILVDSEVEIITDETLKIVDSINLLAVPVGYGGQQPEATVLQKISKLRERILAVNANVAIEVDGGIKSSNCNEYIQAGADLVVIGTGIYHSQNYREAVTAAKENIKRDDSESLFRLRKFLDGNSKIMSDDAERRARLEALRVSLDIPKRSWDPMSSKR